jgi:hypothetical protein
MRTTTEPDPAKVHAGLARVLAEARANNLASELARELFPRLRHGRDRQVAEATLAKALLVLHQRGLLRWET